MIISEKKGIRFLLSVIKDWINLWINWVNLKSLYSLNRACFFFFFFINIGAQYSTPNKLKIDYKETHNITFQRNSYLHYKNSKNNTTFLAYFLFFGVNYSFKTTGPEKRPVPLYYNV